MLYTGADISASLIGQTARFGEKKVGWALQPKRAQPTSTHHTLGLLGRAGLVHS